jgi:hypothetical protein
LLHVQPERVAEARARGPDAAAADDGEGGDASGNGNGAGDGGQQPPNAAAAAAAAASLRLIPAAECHDLLRQGAVVLCHFILAEAPKPPRALQLSTPLTVPHAAVRPGNPALGQGDKLVAETFEDLDEVAARFVAPLVARAGEVASHRRFCPGAREAVSDRLRRDCAEAAAAGRPGAGGYRLGLRVDPRDGGSTEAAGYILAAGGGGGAVGGPELMEPFLIVPEGFWFRRRLLATVEDVVSAFKREPLYSVEQKQREQQQQAQQRMMGGGAGAGGAGAGVAAGGQMRTPAHWGMVAPPSAAHPHVAMAAGPYASGPTPVHPGYGGGYGGYGAAPPAAAAAAAAPPYAGGPPHFTAGPTPMHAGYGGAAAMTPAHPYAMPGQQQQQMPPPQGYYGAGGAYQQQGPPHLQQQQQQQQRPPPPPPGGWGGYGGR